MPLNMPERNLMSIRENRFMQLYRENPKMFRKIRYIAEGGKKDFASLVTSFTYAPSKFEEIIETATHESSIYLQELREHLINLGERTEIHTPKGALLGGLLGIVLFVGSGFGGCIKDMMQSSPYEFTPIHNFEKYSALGCGAGICLTISGTTFGLVLDIGKEYIKK